LIKTLLKYLKYFPELKTSIIEKIYIRGLKNDLKFCLVKNRERPLPPEFP